LIIKVSGSPLESKGEEVTVIEAKGLNYIFSFSMIFKD